MSVSSKMQSETIGVDKYISSMNLEASLKSCVENEDYYRNAEGAFLRLTAFDNKHSEINFECLGVETVFSTKFLFLNTLLDLLNLTISGLIDEINEPTKSAIFKLELELYLLSDFKPLKSFPDCLTSAPMAQI